MNTHSGQKGPDSAGDGFHIRQVTAISPGWNKKGFVMGAGSWASGHRSMGCIQTKKIEKFMNF